MKFFNIYYWKHIFTKNLEIFFNATHWFEKTVPGMEKLPWDYKPQWPRPQQGVNFLKKNIRFEY